MKTTFIYALRDPRTDEVRYVGKADNPQMRLQAHLQPSALRKESHKTHWLRELISIGLLPILDILEEIDHTKWQMAEQQYISILGIRLTNSTAGGEGTELLAPDVAARKAAKLRKPKSPEHCRNISLAKKGSSHGNGHDGMIYSAEWRGNISAARTGGPGHVISEFQKQRTREARQKPYPAFANDALGETIPAGINLRALCREWGLSDAHMHDIMTGKRCIHKGWRLADASY